MRAFGRLGKSAVLASLAIFWFPFGIAFPASPLAEAQAIPRRIRRAPPSPPPASESHPPVASSGAPQNRAGNPAPPLPSTQNPQAPPSPVGEQPAALPPSLLDQPARPAQIHWNGEDLSIQAENASLNAILHALADKTGMEIEGLGEDQRVFGDFGPGKPHDVLGTLLNGSPYDVLMIGSLKNGAPRQLILSQANRTPSSETQSASAPSPQTYLGMTPVHTEEQPASTLPPPQNRQMKTPQELFHELQALRERQQQGGR